MSRRLRKKQLKKLGVYVNPKEVWNLDISLAEYIIPRLKLLKKIKHGYPGTGDMDTPEKWDEALDKMIKAFELHIKMTDLNDDYFDKSGGDGNWKADINKIEIDEAKVKEGLILFATWYGSLWD